MLGTGGIGTGHQHQVESAGGLALKGPQRPTVMKHLGQGPHPGAQLAWTVPDQNNRVGLLLVGLEGLNPCTNSSTRSLVLQGFRFQRCAAQVLSKKNADGET